MLSLFFQHCLGYEPWLAGLALAPQACSAVIASPLGGRAASKTGPLPVMLVGLLIGASGFGGLAFVTTTTPYLVIAMLSFIAGFGMAFAMPAATAAAVAGVPADLVGTASGVVNMARQTGTVIGVATIGGFAATNDFQVGFQHALTIASVVFLVAGALVATALLQHPRHKRPKRG